ncbi:MAG TPA: 23S rRNA (adenine(2030)-N(6))-methyltransferase RlmJ [Rhodobacteraceae bacterium]|jgi:23S rRNA (adenine2030-N6)-methyltransferase|nr:23S rRNA (adenine(2030)-N(6))-methyltransferase RlmJ [Paracoccaceae bacterium]HBV55116.1 23S rRNA (adenine(2030)-N(6))-methyltransferase RlmJ [Paracoccaceae bacterium]
MLSYQHLYHAGNPADVHKHALMAWMLDYLTQKPKPLTYLETHSGRGIYDLGAAEARKTGEAAAGIGQMAAAFKPSHPYSRALTSVRAAYGPQSYPGSPMLAATLLRPEDRIELAELHPQEEAALRDAMAQTQAMVHKAEGFSLALSLCPPTPRRGVLLIDPSYEMKEDYEVIPGRITALHRKWNVGIIVLWYPLLLSGAHRPMLEALEAARFPEVLRHEVRFPPVRPGHRMVGSGMFVINAPWGLADEAKRLGTIFRG